MLWQRIKMVKNSDCDQTQKVQLTDRNELYKYQFVKPEIWKLDLIIVGYVSLQYLQT